DKRDTSRRTRSSDHGRDQLDRTMEFDFWKRNKLTRSAARGRGSDWPRLPPEPYEYAEWKRCRVGLDYHVEIAKHHYSVPHSLARQEVEARITTATVEIFHRGKRVASHLRSTRPHRPTTVPEHMPSAHRRYRDWTHERVRRE